MSIRETASGHDSRSALIRGSWMMNATRVASSQSENFRNERHAELRRWSSPNSYESGYEGGETGGEP
jgi:hypothetical protein